MEKYVWMREKITSLDVCIYIYVSEPLDNLAHFEEA